MMATLDEFLTTVTTETGQPLRLEIGQVGSWTAPGNNWINVLGNIVWNARALSGAVISNGDVVALLKSRGQYLVLGKVV